MSNAREQATLNCILANEEAMKAYQKNMQLLETLPQTEEVRKEYKETLDGYHKYRIKNLELKGEIPVTKQKKSKLILGQRGFQ